MTSRHLAALLEVSLLPKEDRETWLASATDAVGFVKESTKSSEIILHATIGFTLITTALARLENLSPSSLDDLEHAWIEPEHSWHIEHASGGGKPDRVYVSEPLDSPGCNALIGGERLVFRRFFHGVDKGGMRTEVSQRLIHALGLYWVEEYRGYCHLDDHGDIEPVIRVVELAQHGSAGDVLVTVSAEALHRYLAASGLALISKFDFTRFLPGNFLGWHDQNQRSIAEKDMAYHTGLQGNASYANGVHVMKPLLTHDDLVHHFRRKWERTDQQYAVFKAHDWKNNRLAEVSCAPDALASYFEPDSPLPFQITPAFFRPDVLQRYKADPEKYSLDHRSIHSRAGWSLQTYDVNEEGQVHTYLRYLGDLPYSEQLYWQSFNEWPKAPISKRAFKTDIKGDWDDSPDPLRRLQSQVRELDETPPDWWTTRGDAVRDSQHYPLTTSPEEWASALLALDQLIVEGFRSQGIRDRLKRLNHEFEPSWGTLKLLEALLVAQGEPAGDAAAIVEPLKQLHYLRSKVKGHAATQTRNELIRKARSDHGGLKQHFAWLTGECERAFSRLSHAVAAVAAT